LENNQQNVDNNSSLQNNTIQFNSTTDQMTVIQIKTSEPTRLHLNKELSQTETRSGDSALSYPVFISSLSKYEVVINLKEFNVSVV
jgi:hypothetical protein